ncbi:hypothetical protein F4808DRAFT_6632 [Astrocystis sublimbata]|nr:hypothetical protein F4808DRAFT_6632 [Astrocystis sublimbata]
MSCSKTQLYEMNQLFSSALPNRMSQPSIPPSSTVSANAELGNHQETSLMLQLYIEEEPTVSGKLITENGKNMCKCRIDAARKNIGDFEQRMSNAKKTACFGIPTISVMSELDKYQLVCKDMESSSQRTESPVVSVHHAWYYARRL